jgi:hypothetical protein
MWLPLDVGLQVHWATSWVVPLVNRVVPLTKRVVSLTTAVGYASSTRHLLLLHSLFFYSSLYFTTLFFTRLLCSCVLSVTSISTMSLMELCSQAVYKRRPKHSLDRHNTTHAFSTFLLLTPSLLFLRRRFCRIVNGMLNTPPAPPNFHLSPLIFTHLFYSLLYFTTLFFILLLSSSLFQTTTFSTLFSAKLCSQAAHKRRPKHSQDSKLNTSHSYNISFVVKDSQLRPWACSDGEKPSVRSCEGRTGV